MQRAAYCSRQHSREEGDDIGYYTAEEGMAYTSIVNQAKVNRARQESVSMSTETGRNKTTNNLNIDKFLSKQTTTKASNFPRIRTERANLTVYPNEEYATDYEEYATALEDNEEEEDENFFGIGNNEDDTNEEVLNNGGNDGDLEEDLDPAKELMLQFRKYCEEAQNFAPLTNEECDAIKCLVALRKTKAPLNAYESVMEWHLGCKLGESPDYVSRKTLMKKLKERYNIEEDFHGIQEVVELPTSHTCVKVVTNDAGTAIRSLLTDPRVTDEDYLFFDDNPFSPPPDNLTLLGDLNTGLSYRATYDHVPTSPMNLHFYTTSYPLLAS